jgi:bifunctional DNA-binding transcriptional regulator/antitoxin component of YhaV-PrlF toxin-antitoxin module
MREIVKVRQVAGSVVVSLPTSILEGSGIKTGDRVLVEAAPPRRIIITKEGKTMTSTERLELEIDVREKKLRAVDSKQAYILEIYNNNDYLDAGAFGVEMRGLNHDRDQLTVEIAEKKLALYDLQGGPCEDVTPQEA